MNQQTRSRVLTGLSFSFVSFVLGIGVLELALARFLPARQVGPTFTTYSERFGFENKKNLDCIRTTPEYRIRVRTNAWGLRNGPTQLGAAEGTSRALCVGDSSTFGKGTADDEAFCNRLEELLNRRDDGLRYEFLNAGTVSWGTINEYLYLKEEGLSLKPNLVILQLHGNDFRDNDRSSMISLDARGDLEFGAPDPKLKRLVGLFEALPFRSLLENSQLFNRLRLAMAVGVRRGGSKTPPSEGERIATKERRGRLTSLLLEKTIEIVRQAGAEIAIMTHDCDSEQRERIAEVAKRTGTPHLSLDSLSRDRQDLYFPIDAHFTPEGHAHIANELLAFLQQPPLAW